MLKYLSAYDVAIRDHLEKIRKKHEAIAKVGGRSGTNATKKVKGRGSKIMFLSNKMQNNVIDVIGKEIICEIVKRIHECKAWALIADTTPDVSHHEQLSICIRIVDRVGYCSEHLLCCKRAPGATAQQLYDTIVDALKSRGVTFGKIVAQIYDGASNMSGCCNRLQAIFRDEIGSHIVYTIAMLTLSTWSCRILLVPPLTSSLCSEIWRKRTPFSVHLKKFTQCLNPLRKFRS